VISKAATAANQAFESSIPPGPEEVPKGEPAPATSAGALAAEWPRCARELRDGSQCRSAVGKTAAGLPDDLCVPHRRRTDAQTTRLDANPPRMVMTGPVEEEPDAPNESRRKRRSVQPSEVRAAIAGDLADRYDDAIESLLAATQ